MNAVGNTGHHSYTTAPEPNPSSNTVTTPLLPKAEPNNVPTKELFSRPVLPLYASTWIGHCAKLCLTTATRFFTVMYHFIKLWFQGISEESVLSFLNNTGGAVHKFGQMLSKDQIQLYFFPIFWSLLNEEVLESCMRGIARAKIDNRFDESSLETIKQSGINFTEDQWNHYTVIGSGSLNEIIAFDHQPNVVYKVLSKKKALKFHADCNYIKPILGAVWLIARAGSLIFRNLNVEFIEAGLKKILDTFHNEIDLNAEFENTKYFAEAMKGFTGNVTIFNKKMRIETTKVIESEYNSSNLFQMNKISGTTLCEPNWKQNLYKKIYKQSFDDFFEGMPDSFKLIMGIGQLKQATYEMDKYISDNYQVMHADRHEGNFMIDYDETTDEVVLTYIDLGRIADTRFIKDQAEKKTAAE